MRLHTRVAASAASVGALAIAMTPFTGASALSDPSGALDAIPVATYATGQFDQAAAEIPAYDPVTKLVFVVNAQTGSVDILRPGLVRGAATPATPGAMTHVGTLSAAGHKTADGSVVPADAVVNSISIHDGVIAVAVENSPKTERGWVLFFDTTTLKNKAGVRVGAQPDMVTWTPDGKQVITADEAEPADDFSVDPEGTISIIRVNDYKTLRQNRVRTVRFTAYDQGLPLPAGVRVFGPDVPVPAGQPEAGRIARNLEPEYVAVDARSSRAYVTLQEANAVAVVNLDNKQLETVWSMGVKDWSAGGNVLDASDKDGRINLANQPVKGLYMPDTIKSYAVGGQTYLVTADEGDAREWGSYVEPIRLKDEKTPLCPDVFPNAAALKKNEALGRLNVTTASGIRADGSCREEIVAFGGRSFSIRDTKGTLVFDSKGMIETKIAELVAAGVLPQHAFNPTHTETPSFDNRSDDKGPEPEAVEIARMDGKTYVFVGLERQSGVLAYDITDPRAPKYVTYFDNRGWDVEVDEEFTEGMGDLGPEGMVFVPASQSPNGHPLLVVGYEVSGTTTVYQLDKVL